MCFDLLPVTCHSYQCKLFVFLPFVGEHVNKENGVGCKRKYLLPQGEANYFRGLNIMTSNNTTTSAIDYETTIFTLRSDNHGPNRAILLHARTTKNHGDFYKAVLYLHGYIDYFFHDHVCQQFLDHGYDFFALDMRKCGRSIISPEQDQLKHYCTDLHEYDEEISLAIEHIIKQAKTKTKKLVLLGHSTGGLIASLYACSGARHHDIDVVILNSPYLTELDTSVAEAALLNVLTSLRISKDIDAGWYGRSMHVSSRGEWNFDLFKKPIDKVRLHGAFFAAVHTAQQDLRKRGLCIRCPLLFMCSNRSIKPDKIWRDEYSEADLILKVTTTRRAAAMLGPEVTLCEIEKATHDIFLSKQPVREQAFQVMFRWLNNLERDWS